MRRVQSVKIREARSGHDTAGLYCLWISTACIALAGLILMAIVAIGCSEYPRELANRYWGW